jgi:DNA primase
LHALISSVTIQQILSRIDIIDVIGGFVKLKKRGANYLGLCPFHHERTPSFTVSPSKEIYKCFGCGKSGNTISFLMEHEKQSYVEALKWLANKYNVEVEETLASPEVILQQQTAESLFIINQFAQKFFEHQLFETEDGRNIALPYLKERGFNEATIKKFGIGYAPEKRDLFASQAIAQKFNPELLLKSGLVVNRNEQYIDNYRDRIVFPVHNNTGKIIGFGARLIKSNDKAPKYINTPENELYVKSKILYGIYFARQTIDKNDECWLVEGYTDVVSLHQGGIENVVASGGTSLTQDQLRLVKKYTKNLTILYDGDSAGVKAALRGLDMALEEGLNVKLVLIPDKEDPDSYLQKVGAKAFKEFVAANKKDFVLFQLETALKEAGTDSAKKATVVNTIAETIAKIDRAEDFTKRQDFIKESAQLLKIDEAGLTNLVNKFIRNRISTIEKKLPFEEAKFHEQNAVQAEASDFDDQTFNLLFQDELQEKEIVRVLLEHGHKQWDEGMTVADYIFSELPDDDLFHNETVLRLLHEYKEAIRSDKKINKSYFIYHNDTSLSTLTVSLMEFPYEESHRWRSDFSQATGYQSNLFEQDYKSFLRTLHHENKEELQGYLKMQQDNTVAEVESATSYLKLRKIKRLLMENQVDMEKPDADFPMLIMTHQQLKMMEMDLTRKIGTVVFR